MVSSRIPLSFLLCTLAMPALAQSPPVAGQQSPPVAGQAPAPPTAADPFFSTCTRNTQWVFERLSATQLRLTGQAEIECPGMGFSADVIDVFTDPELRLVASGNVVFSNPEGRIAAERVEYNVAKGTGTFHQASGILSLGDTVDRAQFGNQDPDVYFYGDTIEKLSTRSYKLTRGGFTTCVQPTPRWEVTSDSVVINLNDYAIARNMLLRVKGVPLMYLPILYYPIKEDERATGFLLPTYGSSTLRGQALSNAFFWAIGRSQDATFFHDWFTRTGQGFGTEYRYVAGAESNGNLRYYVLNQHATEYTVDDTVTTLAASRSFELAGNFSHALTPRWRARGRVDYVEDILTQQLYNQNVARASNPIRTFDANLAGTVGPVSVNASAQWTEVFSEVTATQKRSTQTGGTPRIVTSLAPRQILGLPIYAGLN